MSLKDEEEAKKSWTRDFFDRFFNKFMIYELFWFVTVGGIFHALKIFFTLAIFLRPDPEKIFKKR